MLNSLSDPLPHDSRDLYGLFTFDPPLTASINTKGELATHPH